MGSPPSGEEPLQHRMQGAGVTASGSTREGRLCSCCAVGLGAGILESWLTVSDKIALPLSMPSLMVVQTVPISQGFIETVQEQGTKWSEGVREG